MRRKPRLTEKPKYNKKIMSKGATKKLEFLCINGEETKVRVDRLDKFGKKLKGLMFRRTIPHNYGVRLSKTPAIHMFFVNFPLDVVFCNKDGEVVSIFDKFKKKITPNQKKLGAWYCYEFKTGTIEREEIKVGDVLSLKIKKVKA